MVVCVWWWWWGALSVITITDWVRPKVCDISQPSTYSVAVEAHLRVTLFSSPPSPPSLIPRAFQCSCVSHAGRVSLAAAV